jgi:hypothetical protein
VSFDPPPCDELTTSEPSRRATRVSPPGNTQVVAPVIAKGRQIDVTRLHSAIDQGRRDRQIDAGLAHIVRRVGEEFRPALCELRPAGLRPDRDAIAARFADRLDHQLIEMVERIAQAFRLAADVGLDIGEHRRLVEIITDDSRHVGVNGLVVGDASADRIRQRNIACIISAHQTGDAQLAVGPEHLGVEEVVIDPAIDYVDPAQPTDRAHIDTVVLDGEVAPLDQRHPHLAGEEDVLEIGRVVDARREQHDLRIAAGHGSDLAHGGHQLHAVIVDAAQTDTVKQIRKGAQHRMAIFDDITDARRGARIVLKHAEGAAPVADDVDAADVHIRFVANRDSPHFRPKIGVVEDQIGGNDAILDDLLLMVEVVEQEVESSHPLGDRAFDVLPFRR